MPGAHRHAADAAEPADCVVRPLPHRVHCWLLSVALKRPTAHGAHHVPFDALPAAHAHCEMELLASAAVVLPFAQEVHVGARFQPDLKRPIAHEVQPPLLLHELPGAHRHCVEEFAPVNCVDRPLLHGVQAMFA